MNIRGERILIFGDSLTHHGHDAGPEVWNVDAGSSRSSSAPGDLLASMLLERGAAAVRTDARVGRSAMNFYSRENAKQLLADDIAWRPTKVIVMLGTNDIGRSPDGTRTAMTAIRDTFKGAGAEVWAIGPPLFVSPSEGLNASAQPVVDIMRSVFGGRFVDARYPTEQAGALQNRARDGVHFTAASARPMAETLASTLSAKLSPTVWWTIGAVVGGASAAWLSWHLISARLRERGAQLRGGDKLRLEIADYEAVDALREAAKNGERYGGRKVFLSSIVDMKDPQTRRVLLALQRDGLIELTRADLVAAMDPKLVKASELDAEGATYHFLVDDSSLKGSLTGPKARYKLGDLPRSMREELFNLHATGVNPDARERAFYAKSVPIEEIDVSRIDVSNYPPESTKSYDPLNLPPIVIANGQLVDGGHRVAEAQRRGIKRLKAIDVTGLIDPSSTGSVAALGDIDINILRHENKWIRIGSMPKAAGYKQIPCKSGLDKRGDGIFRVRCWSK